VCVEYSMAKRSKPGHTDAWEKLYKRREDELSGKVVSNPMDTIKQMYDKIIAPQLTRRGSDSLNPVVMAEQAKEQKEKDKKDGKKKKKKEKKKDKKDKKEKKQKKRKDSKKKKGKKAKKSKKKQKSSTSSSSSSSGSSSSSSSSSGDQAEQESASKKVKTGGVLQGSIGDPITLESDSN